jgi:hypothetical protein
MSERKPAEPVAWAPWLEDEEIPTPTDGLLYTVGERLNAYHTIEAARSYAENLQGDPRRVLALFTADQIREAVERAKCHDPLTHDNANSVQMWNTALDALLAELGIKEEP